MWCGEGAAVLDSLNSRIVPRESATATMLLSALKAIGPLASDKLGRGMGKSRPTPVGHFPHLEGRFFSSDAEQELIVGSKSQLFEFLLRESKYHGAIGGRN